MFAHGDIHAHIPASNFDGASCSSCSGSTKLSQKGTVGAIRQASLYGSQTYNGSNKKAIHPLMVRTFGCRCHEGHVDH
jgi:hypothetical protein